MPKGRTQEIQRLIGHSLRAVMDLPKLGERTVWIDCDVVQADGGTRTASISGAFVALALRAQQDAGKLEADPIKDHVAATSVGILDDEYLLDLNYREDSRADVDMNVVMTRAGIDDIVKSQHQERARARKACRCCRSRSQCSLRKCGGARGRRRDRVHR